MQGLEGQLVIQLRDAGGTATVSSTRPVLASRTLEGKTPIAALKLVPLMFTVCGQAQRCASVRAIESATGRRASVEIESVRNDLVGLETLREHLWQILLSWPTFFDGVPATHSMAALLKTLEETRRRLAPGDHLWHPAADGVTSVGQQHPGPRQFPLAPEAAKLLFAEPAGQWLERAQDSVVDWATQATTIPALLIRWILDNNIQHEGLTNTAPLPPLSGSFLAETIDGPDGESFLAAPYIQEERLETGSLARNFQHPVVSNCADTYGVGLLTRLVARLVEVARLLDVPPVAPMIPFDTAPVPGMAQVEAARGRLCHRVRLSGDQISFYRILAPTEWNFGPTGPAVQALSSLTHQGRVDRDQLAKLIVHAIDPCVGFRLVSAHETPID